MTEVSPLGEIGGAVGRAERFFATGDTSILTEGLEDSQTFLRPLGDRIVVVEVAPPTTTPSGLIIPDVGDRSTRKTLRGIVVAVGPGPRSPLSGEHATMEISVDDEIVYGMHAGIEITVENMPLLVLHETEVVAVLERRSKREEDSPAS